MPVKAKPAEPKLGKDVFIDVSAIVSGNVEIGDHSSVWPHAVLRGDLAPVTVGKHSNIQEQSVVHVDRDVPCRIGDYVTAGHQVCLHGCTIGDEVLVGIGTVILSGATIEGRVVIGAGSLVPEDRVLESGFLYYGSPVKKVRELTPEELAHLLRSAREYAALAKRHLQGAFGRIGLVT
jgi:carbonic anhydrase/acetyltransferase-like protein (isoleucine patch superfamily)